MDELMEEVSRKLMIGVDWMDAQHLELTEKICDLVAAMEEGRGREEVVVTLGFLDRYVIDHFGEEERGMDETGYPDAEAHKLEHAKFKVTLKALRSDLESRNVEILPGKLHDELANWLRNHILEVDKRLGEFLLERA